VALGYAKVTVLGVVQGITELLPISSTAHMRLVPAVLGWQDPGSAFSAAMQLAALAAVVSVCRGDVFAVASDFIYEIVHDVSFLCSIMSNCQRDYGLTIWPRSVKLSPPRPEALIIAARSGLRHRIAVPKAQPRDYETRSVRP
jgi:hypothetical protein